MELAADPFLKSFASYNGGVADAALVEAANALWKAALSAGSSTDFPLVNKAPPIEIGKNVLSSAEKWKLQAALRREETRTQGKEYNKKLLRATKNTKPPTPGEAFPPGRGRPVHN